MPRKKNTNKIPKTAPKIKSNRLQQAITAANTVLGSHEWRVPLEPGSDAIDYISTGSMTVDYLIGGSGRNPCRGVPRGRITQVYGHESCGKTTLALSVAAQACREGGQGCYIDWENAIAPGYAADIGVPIYDSNKFILAQPNTLEEGLKLMWIMGSAGVDLIVLDSVSAGVPEEIWKQKMDDQGHLGRLGLHAAKWSAFLPKNRRQISKSGTAIVAISQLREKINTGGFGHGDSTSTSGGRAWKFYPDIRLKLARVKQESSKKYNAMTHKMEDQKSSGVVRAKIEKSKISDAQGKEQDFYIRFGFGIDDVRSLIDLAARHGIVKKSGAWYIWETPDGDEVRGQGIEKFRFKLEDSGNFESLKDSVSHILSGTGGDQAEDSEEETALEDIQSIMEGFEDPEEAEVPETDSQ